MLQAAPVYSPQADFAERYPDWRWHVSEMHGLAAQVIDYDERTVLIDPGEDGEEWALAVAVAHMDYHRFRGLTFSLEHQVEAAEIAEMRLTYGGEWSVPPVPSSLPRVG